MKAITKTILLLTVGILLFGGLYIFNSRDKSNVQDNAMIKNTEGMVQDGLEIDDGSNTITVLDENDVEVTFDTSDWKTYTNEEFGFSLKYPSDMQINVPVLDVVLRGNEYTIFMMAVTREDLKNPELFSGEVGYALNIDSQYPEAAKSIVDGINKDPSISKSVDINLLSNGRIVEAQYVLKGFAKDSMFTTFQIDNFYFTFGKVGSKYSVAEFIAILSTLSY